LVAILAVCYVAFLNDSVIEQVDNFLTKLQDWEDSLNNHIYLHNNYAPVSDEHRAVPAKVVEGALPEGLNGLFVRNGPNPNPKHKWDKGYHWFDGHGHLHNVRIKSGEALYSNQYVPTPRYQVELQKGKEYFLRIGEIRGILGLIKAVLLEPKRQALHDTPPLQVGMANTQTIMTREHKFYAVHETSLPYEIELDQDGSIVKGIGYETFGGILDYAVSSHPKVDPQNGNFLFHSYTAEPNAVKKDGNYKVGEYNLRDGKLESYFGIRTDDGHTSFAHDLMFTKNWFVVYDNSVHFNFKAMIADGTFFTWTKQHTLKLGLAPRHNRHKANATDDDVIWFDVGTPHVIIHPLNAWEEDDGTVVMWSPTGDYFDVNIDKGNNKYYMAEYRMNPTTAEVKKTVIDDRWNVEFPRIRPDFIGRFGRFGTATIMEPKLGGDALFKGFVVYDMLERKTHRTVLYRDGDVGGEAVVIPKPGTAESHEFYIGTMIRNVREEKSYFVLYDGETGELTTRIELPHRVPYGFHCEWVSDEQLQGHVAYHAGRKNTDK